MHPLKPYFLGLEKPPHHRLTTCQKVFRTTDIEQRRQHHPAPHVLRDARQLLVRRLLQAGRGRARLGAVAARASASTPSDIWVTVFEGDEELGLGPDEEAIEALGGGRRAARADRRRARARRTSGRPARPGRAARARELYLDRGLEWGTADDLPGGENERFLEYWNLVFMQFDQDPVGDADAAAGAEHRHRPGPQPHGADPAGRRRRSSRPTSSRRSIELGARARGATARARRPRAADPRRPLARDDVPDRRRRRAVQRGPRLRAAPGHAPRDPAGPPARHRGRASCRGYADVRASRLMGAALPRAARASATSIRAGLRPRRRASAARSSRA